MVHLTLVESSPRLRQLQASAPMLSAEYSWVALDSRAIYSYQAPNSVCHNEVEKQSIGLNDRARLGSMEIRL